MTSGALWVPLLWIVIVGSRPVSLWLYGGDGIEIDSPTAYLDGSPFDRNLFLLLIVTGFVLLLKRRVNWSRYFVSNRWFFIFFLYCAISVIWADYPFVSFKRWFKEFGNVVMVSLIITEKEPAVATKAVLARFTYIVIPVSVILIKYFPNIGRVYNIWTWEYSYCGITTNKNELGSVLFISGLFLIWDLLDTYIIGKKKIAKFDLLGRIVLLVMLLWLLYMAHSSTAISCLIFGASIIILMQFPVFRRQVENLGIYTLAAVFIIFILKLFPGLAELVVGAAGRDMTLTGRTDIWADLLSMPINPIIGTGYQSFWLGRFADIIWAKYYFHPVQAHNGYLETYLNLGLIGVGLLMAMIISGGSTLKKEVLSKNSFGIFCLSFFLIALFYNITEAMFSGLSLIWITMLISVLKYPRRFEVLNIEQN